MFEYHIKKYKNGLYRVYKMPIQYRNNNKISLKVNDCKIEQSISRAKNTIIDYCLCNKFNYFITITLDSKYNRDDLKSFIKKFNSIIKYEKIKGYDISYLIIPEKHKLGGYHLHGFFNNINIDDVYINKNGFYSIKFFDTLGFNSISKIRNYEATVFYLLKYIGKGFNNIEKGQHLYYHSRELNKSRCILRFFGADNMPFRYDYSNCYNNIKTLDYSSLKKFLLTIKDNDKIYYFF